LEFLSLENDFLRKDFVLENEARDILATDADGLDFDFVGVYVVSVFSVLYVEAVVGLKLGIEGCARIGGGLYIGSYSLKLRDPRKALRLEDGRELVPDETGQNIESSVSVESIEVTPVDCELRDKLDPVRA